MNGFPYQIDRHLLLSWKLDEKLYQTSLSEEQCFQLAYKFANRGIGSVSPNPLVGCVILDRNGLLIGAGGHEKLGAGHAEVNAIQDVKRRYGDSVLQDATVYVTLEPCAHQGRTPSCAKFLAQLPIKKVVVACIDPDPRTSGQGNQILENSGKEVILNTTYRDACVELTEAFHFEKKYNKPFVALKIASDQEGVIANSGDQRRWITNDRSRTYGQFLRRYYDSVLVGAETVALDNPTLDCRIPGFEKTPWRIVLDPKGRILNHPDLMNLNLLKENSQKTIIVTSIATSPNKNFPTLRIHANEHGFDLHQLLAALHSEFHIQSVLVEGGARTWGAFVNNHCVQKIHHFQAASKIGGADKIYWNQFMKDQLVTQKTREISLDQDKLTEYTPNHSF